MKKLALLMLLVVLGVAGCSEEKKVAPTGSGAASGSAAAKH